MPADQPDRLAARPPLAAELIPAEPVRAALRVKATLHVGAADDAAEADADRRAGVALQNLANLPPADLEFDESRIHRVHQPAPTSSAPAAIGRDGGQLDEQTQRGIDTARGSGQPLAGPVRASMEHAFGVDFGQVRIHDTSNASRISRSISAQAFTTGNDIFFAEGVYQPDSPLGQRVLAHELAHTVQQRGSSLARLTDPRTIHRVYTDFPTKAVWKSDSDVSMSGRSKELLRIDNAVADYDSERNNPDLAVKRQLMQDIFDWIEKWESAKGTAGLANSDRAPAIADLKTLAAAKISENLDAHAVALAPLAKEYRDAAAQRDYATTAYKAKELGTKHSRFFVETATAALTTNNMAEWATLFFTMPQDYVGARPFDSQTLAKVADFSWLTSAQVDNALKYLIKPSAAGTSATQFLQMLQVQKFRRALVAAARPTARAELMEMPLMRIATAADTDIATKGANPSITAIADSVFSAFLGDQPISALGYGASTAEFDAKKFLLGNSPQAKRAPCMTLSNMLTDVLNAVLPKGDPRATPIAIKNPASMLTKPLATIGTGNGILTREPGFKGNVERFGTVVGHAAVNRIFFSHGHEWLQVGDTEYDPTLGVSGPVGTVASLVEATTYAAKGKAYLGSDGTKVTRNNHVPPGGKAMLFNRSVVIV
ncbi:uncharacterized protein DUF4157 [Jatrophihabitans sp. GAS493]|uniref:eCIS core domain-containing protein n=1 Tax=Jatrophihabitans sp. GAS493 TaxID=1907575 RepID=UPI000BB93EFE|nr:DUF4157 domain-containing protein [Jatrophihabitans sp. GAS493]SOD70961.1 uncharacterized protein DUF4157 [Jatrophihabitans sp. GAS493]